jgi:hypothetical protein
MSQTNEERNARRRERYEENKRMRISWKSQEAFLSYLGKMDSATDVIEFYFNEKYGVTLVAIEEEEEISFLMESIDSIEYRVERRMIVREAEALLK